MHSSMLVFQGRDIREWVSGSHFENNENSPKWADLSQERAGHRHLVLLAEKAVILFLT